MCASCHADGPDGFRAREFRCDRKVANHRRRSEHADRFSGTLPDGTKFKGPVGLRKMLLGKPDQFATTVIEKLLTYAIGRGVEYYDEPAVRKIVREAAQDDYRWSSLILGVVKSEPFQMRRSSRAMMIFKKAIPRRAFCAGSARRWRCPFWTRWSGVRRSRRQRRQAGLRMGVMYVPNGIIMEKWTPRRRERAFEMTPILEPLAPFRERFLDLERTRPKARRTAARRDSAQVIRGPTAAYLTGVHPKTTEGADIHAGISVDQIAAKEIGRQASWRLSKCRWILLRRQAHASRALACTYMNTIAWRSLPRRCPWKISRARYSNACSATAIRPTRPRAWPREGEAQSSRRDDARMRLSFKQRLGPADRAKLAEYLEAIRDVERRIQIAETTNRPEVPTLASARRHSGFA